MASTQGIKAGAAYVELLVKDNQLVKGLQAAAQKLQAFAALVRTIGTRLTGIGAMLLAPFGASGKVYADLASELVDMSQRTGIGIEALSELSFAAEQSGADLATLESGVRKMQKSILSAAKGSKTAQEALGYLGLTVEKLQDLSPEQQFKLIADRLSKIGDPTLKAAVAMELLGRSGTQLLPLMADGAAGIEALQQQARELGLTIGTVDALAAEAFGDQLDLLWRVLKQGVFVIGSAVAPALAELVGWISRVTVGATNWINQNRNLVLTIFKLSAAVLAGGIVLVALGGAMSALGYTFGAVATILTGAGSTIGMIGTVLAAMLTPIGLVITAVSALGAYLLYTTEVGAQALAWLGQRFTTLKDTALQAYQGIADALAAGEIALAARILWLSLKLAWDQGIAQLQRVWLSFSGFFLTVGYGAFYGILSAAEEVWHGMKTVWIEGVSFVRKLWSGFLSWHATTVAATADAMMQAWIWAREQTGAITPEQAEFERGYAKRQLAGDLGSIEQERQQGLGQIDQEHAAARDREDQRHRSRMEQIGQGFNDAQADLENEHAEKVRRTEESLAQARKEWQEAIEAARQKRQATEGQEADAPRPGSAPRIDDLADQLSGLGDLLDQKAQQTLGVAGTFNAMEARGLGAGGVADRIARAAEETARNTKRLIRAVEDHDEPEFE